MRECVLIVGATSALAMLFPVLAGAQPAPQAMTVNLGSSSFQAAEAITAGVTGAGVNGPGHAQVGMSAKLIKNGWWLAPGAPGGPAIGEEDGVYSTTYQGGAGSDTNAYLGQITATGLGFASVLEGTVTIQPPITSGNGAANEAIDVQAGSINLGKTIYGFNANQTLKGPGAIATGYSLNGGGWDYGARWFNGGALIFQVDGQGNLYAPTLSGAGDAITIGSSKQTLSQAFASIQKLLAALGSATPSPTPTPTPTPAPTPAPSPVSSTLPATFADPAGGQTQLGFGIANTHEFAVRNSAANANTFAIENDDPAGFAAATFRGVDLAYDIGQALEHAAFGWAPRCNLRGGVGCDYLEISRYDGRQNPHMLPPPFALIQTGGEFTAPPVPVVVAITAGSTTATIRQGALPTAAAIGQNLTSVEYPNYLAEGATVTAVKGSTLTLSKPSVMTNGWVPAEYGPTAYGQYNTVELTETGPINFYRFVDSNGGAMHDPFLVLDRTFGTVRIGAVPVAPQQGGYAIGRGDCGTVIRDIGAAPHTYEVPAGLPTGCTILVVQAGAGSVAFAGAAGETIEQMGSGTLAHRTAARFAEAKVLIDGPSTFLLSGQVQ